MFDSNFSFSIYQSVSIFSFFPSSLSKRLEYYENIQDEILIFKRIIRITECINKNFLQIVIFESKISTKLLISNCVEIF